MAYTRSSDSGSSGGSDNSLLIIGGIGVLWYLWYKGYFSSLGVTPSTSPSATAGSTQPTVTEYANGLFAPPNIPTVIPTGNYLGTDTTVTGSQIPAQTPTYSNIPSAAPIGHGVPPAGLVPTHPNPASVNSGAVAPSVTDISSPTVPTVTQVATPTIAQVPSNPVRISSPITSPSVFSLPSTYSSLNVSSGGSPTLHVGSSSPAIVASAPPRRAL